MVFAAFIFIDVGLHLARLYRAVHNIGHAVSDFDYRYIVYAGLIGNNISIISAYFISDT